MNRSGAYYNEHDKSAAAWLRELIKAGLIPEGEVDERSIEDVAPADLAGFVQHHFFAGIGGWPFALRLAGWPDERPVWTGSCPCQPFSAAGKGGGFADERHLWPAFFWLIGERRPDLVFGEQVEGPAGRTWLDLVFSDLEGCGYACGAAVFPAAGVGAPHGRHRTYWVADAERRTSERHGLALGAASSGTESEAHQRQRVWPDSRDGSVFVGMADAHEGERGRLAVDDLGDFDRQDGRRSQDHGQPSGRGGDGRLADASQSGLSLRQFEDLCGEGWRGEGRATEQCGGSPNVLADDAGDGRREERSIIGGIAFGDREERRPAGFGASGGDLRPGADDDFWRASDWLFCRDGKWRPVEPGTQPLVDGLPDRLVAVCPHCKTETRTVKDGAPEETRPREILQVLRLPNGTTQTAEWRLGGDEHLQKASILQSSVFRHDDVAAGIRPRRGACQSETGCEENFLQSVWIIREASGSSPGPEPFQQRQGELGSLVRSVPSGRAREGTIEVYLRSLRRLICSEGSSPESQNLLCPVCERMGTNVRIEKMASRVGQLRGYGNAIVPQQAVEFIRAALEVEG